VVLILRFVYINDYMGAKPTKSIKGANHKKPK